MGILEIFDSVLEIFGWYRGDILLVSWRSLTVCWKYFIGLFEIFDLYPEDI